MTGTTIQTTDIPAGSYVWLMAQVKNIANAYLTTATSVVIDVIDTTDSENTYAVDAAGAKITTGHYETPSVSSVIFATMQTDSRWKVDSTGFNFGYAFAAPLQDKTYEVRATITATDAKTYVVVWRFNCY